MVAGFKPIMPTFQGQITEEQLMALMAYMKSLGQTAAEASAPSSRPLRAEQRAPAIKVYGNMATAATNQSAERENYLNAGYGLKSWLLTTDHKRIAILYLMSITFFFLIGGFFAMLIRLELLTPAGDLVSGRHLQQAVHDARHHHGVLLPDPVDSGRAGQLLVPLMIGREGPGFPADQPAELVPLHARRRSSTLYAMSPAASIRAGRSTRRYSSDVLEHARHCRRPSAIFIAGFSSILTGLNFIVTIHRMRAPGLTWFRLPLFIWSHYATSIIMVLGTPVIAITLVLVALERAFTSASSTRSWAAIRCCSSTCSGSIRTRPCTS